MRVQSLYWTLYVFLYLYAVDLFSDHDLVDIDEWDFILHELILNLLIHPYTLCSHH